MKIHLTIKVDYLPSWGAYEGVRELLQNAKDAEVESSATMSVRYRKDSGTLVIENDGVVLPHEALLLGHTTKLGRSDTIGKFGEGLKLGILALVRAGHKVKIRSGSEVWVPSIERSDKFDADVLVFDISKGREPKDRVQVEIGNFAEEDWNAMSDCFLFLLKPEELEKVRINTYQGGLLLGEKYVGRVYLKGIFVGNDPKLRYGYDLREGSIDRDRKMVDKYDLQYTMRGIWQEAMNTRPDLVEPFIQMLSQSAADLEGISTYSADTLSPKVRQAVVASFQAIHGTDALPVENLADSKDIEHLGKKGVVAPKGLKAVLDTVLGSTEAVKANLRNEVVQSFGWSDLDTTERENLERAIAMVNAVEPVSLDTVDVVSFRDEKIQGMFKDGRYLLSKPMLAALKDTLTVLVHEVAHQAGGDGDKGHVATIERIWAGITMNLLGAS